MIYDRLAYLDKDLNVIPGRLNRGRRWTIAHGTPSSEAG